MRALTNGLMAVGLLSLVGCGDGMPKTVPVSGTVYLDDKPIEGVSVRFITEKYAGAGTTDAQGKYQLQAVAGDNGVVFSKAVSLAGDSRGGGAGQSPGGFNVVIKPKKEKDKDAKPEIPADYSDSSKPKEKFNVPSGGSTSADFHLKSSG